MGLSVTLRKKVKGFDLNASWSIHNELAVIFGPSGAGKSLTLQLIAGLMTPDIGHISMGETVFFDSTSRSSIPTQNRSIGYVFQDLALFPHMTVEENILYGATGVAMNDRKRRYDECIDIFHLEKLEKKKPCEISGGQKQRVAFARALIRKPQLLLLDEPFSALDTELRGEMRDFLRDIRKAYNIPVILVTHDVFEAYSLADTVIVYSEGRVVHTGTPHEVFDTQEMAECEFPLYFSYMLRKGFF